MAANFQTALEESKKLYFTLKSLENIMPSEYKTFGFNMGMADISNKIQSCNEILIRIAKEME